MLLGAWLVSARLPQVVPGGSTALWATLSRLLPPTCNPLTEGDPLGCLLLSRSEMVATLAHWLEDFSASEAPLLWDTVLRPTREGNWSRQMLGFFLLAS